MLAGASMITMLLIALVLVIGPITVSLLAAVPLLRTLSAAIDAWADSVHGDDGARPV